MRTPQIDFGYTPLSDQAIVKALIQNRIMLDPCVSLSDVKQDAILAYIALDDTIACAGLSPMESRVVAYIMDGYTITDISELNGGVRGTYSTTYIRAVNKITAASKRLWAEFYGDSPAKGICYEAHSKASNDILREPDRQGNAAKR